jgi:hypothetical protein
VHAFQLKIKNKIIYILDTPGIKDTRGMEADVANNLSIAKAL